MFYQGNQYASKSNMNKKHTACKYKYDSLLRNQNKSIQKFLLFISLYVRIYHNSRHSQAILINVDFPVSTPIGFGEYHAEKGTRKARVMIRQGKFISQFHPLSTADYEKRISYTFACTYLLISTFYEVHLRKNNTTVTKL